MRGSNGFRFPKFERFRRFERRSVHKQHSVVFPFVVRGVCAVTIGLPAGLMRGDSQANRLAMLVEPFSAIRNVFLVRGLSGKRLESERNSHNSLMKRVSFSRR